MDENQNAQRDVEMWQINNIIKSLSKAKANGTSMISLIINYKDQLLRVSKLLNAELCTASHIKSRANRLSVLTAIVSVQQKLKLYTKVPRNGLVIYCGIVVGEDGKEQKINVDFEPFKPINTSLYLCDNKFHTEALQSLFSYDHKYGFIIIDGHSVLYGIVYSNKREILHKFPVDLPKKHGRGGQSAMRFSRIRIEKRNIYIRKAADIAKQIFLDSDHIITSLIIGGCADLKHYLVESESLDPRLKSKVVQVVDVAYGGQNGFNQAIDISSNTLKNVQLIQHKKFLAKYLEQVKRDSGKYCYGIENTLEALRLGAVETLICWENLDIQRYVLMTFSDNKIVLHLSLKEEKDKSHFKDKDTGSKYELVEKQTLVEWLVNNYKSFGTTLMLISNQSTEGCQFINGFGGIGGLLRYKIDFDDKPYPDDGLEFNIDDY